jgi:WXXGXW repeat (2 copies)
MRKAILSLLLATFLCAVVLPQFANADEWDKKTIVTFNQDVAIPGQVLPAGTYVFKLLRSGSDRFVVQVWTAHEEQLVASLMTAGDSYPNASGDAYFVLDMSGTDEGFPPAVASWFFAGGNDGRDFIYSGYSTSRLVSDQAMSSVVPAATYSPVGVSVAITNPPPALPVYDQPVCPGDGYVWTPGYWAWADDSSDYYWVPGTWVLAPEVGLLWTPGYWGWGGDSFLWHEGYWGPQVGFYGGIDYGFGYFGVGFVGGRWDNGRFLYNRAVSNVNLNLTRNVYSEEVSNVNVNRVSFNGGNGGINARPTPQEEAAERGRHIPPVAAQLQHTQAARGNPELRASANLGKPAIAATARPGAFEDNGVLRAREAGAPYSVPANRAVATDRTDLRATRSTPLHAKDLPAIERPAAPNTGDAKLDKKYMQQQDELVAKQEVERQQLQRQQDKEHQRLAKQTTDDHKIQQVEQQHQQQTQQMAQRHSQEMHDLQQVQQPPRQTALKSRE